MSRREKERKKSLDMLAKLAWQSGGGSLPAPKPQPQPKSTAAAAPHTARPQQPAPARAPPREAPRPSPSSPPARAPPASSKPRPRSKGDPMFEGRAAKQEEARLLRERRERELARASQSQRPQPAAYSPGSPAAEPRRTVGGQVRKGDPRFEGRAAKQEEARLLRERRERELHRNTNLEWRGMSNMGVPASIRRTGFDRVEPDVQTKISDILGEAKEKEGRAKNRDRGRRQGGGGK